MGNCRSILGGSGYGTWPSRLMGVEQSFIDFVESSKGFGFDFKSSGSPLNGVKQNVTRSVLCFLKNSNGILVLS